MKSHVYLKRTALFCLAVAVLAGVAYKLAPTTENVASVICQVSMAAASVVIALMIVMELFRQEWFLLLLRILTPFAVFALSFVFAWNWYLPWAVSVRTDWQLQHIDLAFWLVFGSTGLVLIAPMMITAYFLWERGGNDEDIVTVADPEKWDHRGHREPLNPTSRP
jgi:hypothetical protein